MPEGALLVTSVNFVSSLCFILMYFAAVRCAEPNPAWIVDDDRIDGVLSVEGRPLEHAEVKLSSSSQQYRAMTDTRGAFLIPNVAVGSYSFRVQGWGEAHLEVKGWHRGAINRPVLFFSLGDGCRFLMKVSN